MSSVTLNGDTSGAVLLQAPAIAGSTTINIAAQSGTLNVGGPAFSVYKSASQSISTNTATLITYDTEVFDTNSNFASNRFTPTVAGYYQINLTGSLETTSSNKYIQLFIYKNGSVSITSQPAYGYSVAGNGVGYGISGVIYCNGSTDYIEAYAYTNSGTTILNSGVNNTFSGFLARAA